MAAAPDEFGLIETLFAPLSRAYPGALGLRDDAALVTAVPGLDMAVTVDALVAGVHFLPDDPPDLIARKLVRVNLSDLAAKGAKPFAVLLAAAFPRETGWPWLDGFARGLAQDLDAYGVALIGGDTVATPGPLTLSLTAFGHVPVGRALLRSAARAGDWIWVSGTLGDGALGLGAAQGTLRGDPRHLAFLADRYRLPCPRLALGQALVGLAHAAMDISDGLVQDLGHICRASTVAAEIEAAALPLSEAARAVLAAGEAGLERILTGGDDYELVFTAPPDAAPALERLARDGDTALTRIGRIVADVPGAGPEEGRVLVRDANGARMRTGPGGWRHFGGERERET